MSLTTAVLLLVLAGHAVVFAQKYDEDSPAAPLTTVTFSAPGAATWTVPTGVTSIQVQAWGSGGGGGNATGSNFAGAYAGGGGGGAYSRSVLSVIPGTVYNLSVGAGGIHTSGNSSSFGSNLVVALGGAGGADAAASGFTAGTGVGGPGGSLGVGSARFSGGGGAQGNSANGSAGGGGAAAGNINSGTSGTAPTGGIGFNGGGSGGDAQTSNGFPGQGPGGGGAGARSGTFAGQTVGGRGADGKVVITYPPFFTATGRVITATGRGIRGATLTVTGGGLANPIVVHTGPYGRYTVMNLPFGSYTFTYSARRFTFTNPGRSVNSFDSDLTIPDVIAN